VIINPVDPNYFYLRKVQGIDNNFEIRNYVLSEDKARIEQLVNQIKAEHPEGSDDGSEDLNSQLPPKGKDYFEEALERMRQNKEYNIDEDGMTKQMVDIGFLTRGTNASLVPGISEERDHEGGSSEGDAQEATEDHEEADQEEESGVSASITVQPEEEEEENENEGEGESEPENGFNEEDEKAEEVINQTKVEAKPAGIGKVQSSPQKNGDVKKQPTIFDAGMGMMGLEQSGNIAGQQVAEEKKDDTEEVKEEEEQFNWEELKFKYFNIENSGNTFKQEPEVFCCCKIETFGYSIVQKLFIDSIDRYDGFKFNDKPYFSA
jgi:hypothetical protein